jgi:hypothetical protein
MKRKILFILQLLSIGAFGQETTVKTKRWAVGITLSPDYCYRTLGATGNGSLWESVLNGYNNLEIPKFGYTAGLNVMYTLNKHFSIDAGVQYSNKGYAYDLSTLVFGDMIDPRFGFTYTVPSMVADHWFYNFNFLEIPLRLVYLKGEKKTQLTASIGITPSIFLNANERIVNSETGTGQTITETIDLGNNYTKVSWSPTISAGVQYNANDRLCIRAEPMYRYGLTSIHEGSIKRYLWNIGLALSCYYKL